MAARMETILAVLLVILILVSGFTAATLFSMRGALVALSEDVDNLSEGVTGLADEMATLAEAVGASTEAIDEIRSRLGEVEAKISPTITVIGPWSGAEMDAFLPVLQRFEAITGINVRYKVYRAEELATILPAQFEAGETPGDVIFMWAWWIIEAAKDGHVVDVTGVINEDDYVTGALDPVTLDGKLYGAAYTGKAKPGFWYRKSFFAAHGLTPPNTWEEFIALLDKIKTIPGIENPIVVGDGVGWPISDLVEHFLITYGGPENQLDLINGAGTWTSGWVRDVFETKIVPLIEAGYVSEPVEWTMAVDLWWRGDYALYFMGSWITGMVDDPDDLGIFPLPGASGVVFGADYFFIPKYTENMDAAIELFKFLAGAEAQRIQVSQGGHIATNKNVPLDFYPAVDRMVASLLVDMVVLPDLDDSIGGRFQVTFWDQLKLLWVNPGALDDVLSTLETVYREAFGGG
jgi:multiple sugar transport system substrate-binding protein